MHTPTFLPLLLGVSNAIKIASDKSLVEFLAKPSSASGFLASNVRHRRHNKGFGEEVRAGNYERECVEEQCSFEELNEVTKDEAARDRAWNLLTKRCTVDKFLCSAAGTHTCVQKWNERECICHDGFTGETCDEDIDECAGVDNPCCGNAVCSNTLGGYQCACDSGYENTRAFGLLDTQEGSCEHDCQDIDECESGEHTCTDDQLCENHPGSFTCEDLIDVTPEEGSTPGSTSVIPEPIEKSTAVSDPTTIEPVTYPERDDDDCRDPCAYNNGLGGCEYECQSNHGQTDNCADYYYWCSCAAGYRLSCDGKSCVADNTLF